MTFENGELHLHLDDSANCLTTYCATEKAIENGCTVVHTTIPHFLSWRLNRRLFVHVDGQIHEIKLGDCEGTERIISEGHNIERLLISGEFSWFNE